MERINGYLWIDDCERVLIDKDKNQHWVYISGEEYFFKPMFFTGVYNELIGYYAAKILGIDACYYDLAVLNGECGYISKSLRGKDIKLVSGEELLGDYLSSVSDNGISAIDVVSNMGIDKRSLDDIKEEMEYEGYVVYCADYVNNLEVIWQALEYRYGNSVNIKELMDQFIMMYIYVILMGDADKHCCNWMVIESDNSVRLAPLFDNELIFTEISNTTKYSVGFKDDNWYFYTSLEEFFYISSCEYCELFIEMFEKLKNDFNSIFERIKGQIGVEIPVDVREKTVKKFNIHCDKINWIITEYRKKGLKRVKFKSNVVNL